MFDLLEEIFATMGITPGTEMKGTPDDEASATDTIKASTACKV